MPTNCPFGFIVCTQKLPCYQCLNERLEMAEFHLREAGHDSEALLKLSTGLHDRFGGKRPDWAVPSNCGTALIYIDRLKAKVEELLTTLEWLIPPAGCSNYDCEQAQIKVREALARHREPI
jgi:hypothetical protein